MKKATRRVGAVFIILLFGLLSANLGLWHGAQLGYDAGYYEGASFMYNKLVQHT